MALPGFTVIRSITLLATSALAVLLAACAGSDDSSAAPAIPATATPGGSSTTVITAIPHPTAAAAPAVSTGGTLRIAQASDPASCDLHMSQGLSYQSVHPCNVMLSQLIRFAADDYSVLEPDLAMEWSTADGATWFFLLRDGVRWHDGSEVTSVDVVFSLRRVIEPPDGLAVGRAGAFARYVSSPGNVQAVDDRTVQIVADYPAASLFSAIANVYLSIYPKAATEALDPPSMAQFGSVVGSGPFRPGNVVRGSSYEADRNGDYYLPDLPYLDAVKFLVMPEPAVRLTGLVTGAVDAIAVITESEALTLERDHADSINVFRSPSAGGNTVQLNMRSAPFDDPRVRRAVNLAISRPDANVALGPGYAGAILPPGGEWSLREQDALALPGYGDKTAERAEARRLLSEAGFAGGFNTTIRTRANPFFETLAELAAGQLALIGVRATVTPVEAVAYQDSLIRGDFEMIAHSHSFALDDPDSVLFDHYTCDGVENYPGLCDPEIDALIQEQSRELDHDVRRRLLSQIERRIWEADGKIWLQWSARRTAVSARVHGLEPGGPSLYQGRRLDRVWVQ